MATFKIEVNSNLLRRDGRYPVRIRLTHNRKLARISTGYYAGPKELTKTFDLKNTALITTELSGRIREYEKIVISLGLKINQMDAAQLKNYLLEKTKIDSTQINFIEYGQKIIHELKQKNRKSSATVYSCAIKNLHAYLNGNTLYISDITSSFLQKYEDHLSHFGKRVPSAYMTVIQAIFNRARDEFNDEDNNIIRISNNPFRKYKKPKQNTANKRGLTSCDVQKIFAYQPVGVRDEIAKDLFMMSFFLAGTNTADFYHAPPIRDGYLTYNRIKTKDRRVDEAFIKIRIEPEIEAIIEKYKGDETHAFNFHKRYTDTLVFNQNINKGLKIIGKSVGIENLQYYAARHSLSTIAYNECGIDKYTINELLNHSAPDMKTTEYYIVKDFKNIWKAQRKIIDFILNPAH